MLRQSMITLNSSLSAKPIISVKEARKILGKDANGMSDEDIESVVQTLDLLAKDALQKAKVKIRMKKDAKALAELIYDCYIDSKRLSGK